MPEDLSRGTEDAKDLLASSIGRNLRNIASKIAIVNGKEPTDFNIAKMTVTPEIKVGFKQLMDGYQETEAFLEISSLLTRSPQEDGYTMQFFLGGNYLELDYWYKRFEPGSSEGMIKSFFEQGKTVTEFVKTHRIDEEEALKLDGLITAISLSASVLEK